MEALSSRYSTSSRLHRGHRIQRDGTPSPSAERSRYLNSVAEVTTSANFFGLVSDTPINSLTLFKPAAAVIESPQPNRS